VGGYNKSMSPKPAPDDFRPEYKKEDLGQGVLGKYYESYQSGTNIILLDPEVAAVFPNSESVNQALKSLIEVAKSSVKASSSEGIPQGSSRATKVRASSIR
jgi:hypothetical protein